MAGANPWPSGQDVRVLHVLNELRASGAEVMLHSAAGQWKEHGVEAHVLAVAPVEGAFAADLRAVGYSVAHETDDPLRRVPARLRRRVSAGRYDVVHLHAELGNFWFGLAARSAGAAVLRTVHNVFAFGGFLRAERVVQRRVLRWTGAAHVCVGTDVARNERQRFGNPADVVDNWCDASFAPPTRQQRSQARAALGLSERDLVAVSVGNCSAVKRHEMILAAMAHPACPPRLVYLHVGEEEPARGERRLAAQLEVLGRTRFLGRTHPLMALHAADVFVMPSAYEGLGIAAVEALATGLPAVLADVPGLRDVAAACPAALLTDVAPGRLAAAIAAAIGTAAGWPERRRAEPEDVDALRDRFGMARGVARYAGIYRRLARPRRP